MSRRINAIRGFTVVELLIVVAILSLLISIGMPSINNAKNIAKSAATRSLIHSLDSGLELFKSDETLGRKYPPSF
ncbi:MAG: type II secretion system protein, partial [Planctomycetota bacterium]